MPLKDFKLKICDLKFKLSGFSLLELLLALSIIGLVTAVAIPNLRNFNRGQEIDGAVAKLADVLRNAKSSASSRIQCPNGVASTGWHVVLSPNNYVMNCFDTANRQVLSTPYAATPTSSTTFRMTNNRCTVGQVLTISFNAHQVSYDCAGVVGTTWPVTLTISNVAGTISRQLIIERGGIVRID